jgi:hypothetical protein
MFLRSGMLEIRYQGQTDRQNWKQNTRYNVKMIQVVLIVNTFLKDIQ